jgi:hypothetical protein
MAVLVACGYRPGDALGLVKRRRFRTQPNSRQLEGLHAYALQVRGKQA